MITPILDPARQEPLYEQLYDFIKEEMSEGTQRFLCPSGGKKVSAEAGKRGSEDTFGTGEVLPI